MTVAALRKAGVEVVDFDLAKFHRDLDALGVGPYLESSASQMQLITDVPFLEQMAIGDGGRGMREVRSCPPC